MSLATKISLGFASSEGSNYERVVIIRIMVFPLDDNFVFGDNFFSWLIIFFSPKATKKITQPTKKKLLTNKRSYSSNGNTIIPMI